MNRVRKLLAGPLGLILFVVGPAAAVALWPGERDVWIRAPVLLALLAVYLWARRPSPAARRG